jgi:hypothetical protein
MREWNLIVTITSGPQHVHQVLQHLHSFGHLALSPFMDVNEAEERAAGVLREHGADPDRLTGALEEEKHLDHERIETLLGSRQQPAAAPQERSAPH